MFSARIKYGIFATILIFLFKYLDATFSEKHGAFNGFAFRLISLVTHCFLYKSSFESCVI